METIILRREEGVGTIILNRPEVRNAMNEPMAEELAAAIDDIAHDDNIRVLVITGAGAAFCAGADFRFKGVRAGEILAEKAEDLAPILKAAMRGELLNKIQSRVILALQRLEELKNV